MSNIFNNMTTSDYITLAIALFGAVGTLITWGHYLLTNRKDFDINILKYNYKDERWVFDLQIINNSQSPLTVTRIELVSQDKTVMCETLPKYVGRQSRTIKGEEVVIQTYLSLALPINLAPQGGIGGCILFQVPQSFLQSPSNTVTFRVYSNRGQKSEKTVLLPHTLTAAEGGRL